jgi:hypothetical protein
MMSCTNSTANWGLFYRFDPDGSSRCEPITVAGLALLAGIAVVVTAVALGVIFGGVLIAGSACLFGILFSAIGVAGLATHLPTSLWKRRVYSLIPKGPYQAQYLKFAQFLVPPFSRHAYNREQLITIMQHFLPRDDEIETTLLHFLSFIQFIDTLVKDSKLEGSLAFYVLLACADSAGVSPLLNETLQKKLPRPSFGETLLLSDSHKINKRYYAAYECLNTRFGGPLLTDEFRRRAEACTPQPSDIDSPWLPVSPSPGKTALDDVD